VTEVTKLRPPRARANGGIFRLLRSQIERVDHKITALLEGQRQPDLGRYVGALSLERHLALKARLRKIPLLVESLAPHRRLESRRYSIAPESMLLWTLLAALDPEGEWFLAYELPPSEFPLDSLLTQLVAFGSDPRELSVALWAYANANSDAFASKLSFILVSKIFHVHPDTISSICKKSAPKPQPSTDFTSERETTAPSARRDPTTPRPSRTNAPSVQHVHARNAKSHRKEKSHDPKTTQATPDKRASHRQLGLF